MEFAFGTNWSAYSRFVGNIFGAPLAAEGMLSFFVESSFLGIVLFGKNRISSRFYYASVWIVFVAALNSAFWILVANSWMHTPAGFAVEDGRAVLTNIWAAIFTKSLAPRFVHTVNATFMTGAFISAGIAAHYLLKKRHVDFAKRALTTALIVGTHHLGGPAVPGTLAVAARSPPTSRSRWPPSRRSTRPGRTSRSACSAGWTRAASAR